MQLLKLSLLLIAGHFSEILHVTAEPMELKADFGSGSVKFSPTVNNRVKISFHNLTMGTGDNLTIHQLPVKFNGPVSEICDKKYIGKIFDPRSAMDAQNYESDCKNSKKCAVGDLTGRIQNLGSMQDVDDASLSLSGKESIFGRSLVLTDNTGTVVGCATINSLSPVKTVIGVFRAISPGIAGTIVLRQSQADPDSDTSVYVNLMLVDARSESKKSLSLALHQNAPKSNEDGSCTGIGKVFNPLGKTSCDKMNPETCPIGDISAKLGSIEVKLPGANDSQAFFIDSNLPLSGSNSVVGRSLVISENGHPLICAKIQEIQEMETVVKLEDKQGSNGMITFKQSSMYEPVMVNVSVKSVQIGFHQHLDSSCNVRKTEGSWHNITRSRKSNGLTLYGPKSIVFRPVVINNDGSPVCRTVQPKQPTYHIKAMANFNGKSNGSVIGNIKFEQIAFDLSKAFGYLTSISLDLKYQDETKKTNNHNWHVHVMPVLGDSSLAIGKRCKSAKGHYNPYNVYVKGNEYSDTCNPSFPFRCELGDLSNKLGTYSIGSGQKLLTETENYLASWHNIIGRSVVVHAKDRGESRIACADIIPQEGSSFSQETLICKNSSKTRDKVAFQKTISDVLKVSSWRVADMKFETAKEGATCLKYTFLLIDDSKSNMHLAFKNVINDEPGKLKDFSPACGDTSSGWKIHDGHAAEIVGVTFGIIALIVLVICIIVWLKKKHGEDDDKSELVVEDGDTATNAGLSVETEPVEVRIATDSSEQNEQSEVSEPARRDSAKEYKVTTSL